ncbi:ATP-dependent DNA helicase PIF1-like protein [Tanacetum coccineum]
MDNRLIREALDFDMNKSKSEHQQLHSLLNPEQRLIYEEVIESVHNQRCQFYFVYGSGRTGKTFLYKTIISRLRSERKIVLAAASSGGDCFIAPTGRRTAHSRFVIPLELLENSTCGIKQNTHLAELMQEVQLIIWDEAPMTHKYASYQKYAVRQLNKTLQGLQKMEENMTQLCNIDHMLDDLKVLVRCISLWKSHPTGKPNEVHVTNPQLAKDLKQLAYQAGRMFVNMNDIPCLVEEGDTKLIYAAAGEVGSLLYQWENKFAATVIGANLCSSRNLWYTKQFNSKRVIFVQRKGSELKAKIVNLSVLVI